MSKGVSAADRSSWVRRLTWGFGAAVILAVLFISSLLLWIWLDGRDDGGGNQDRAPLNVSVRSSKELTYVRWAPVDGAVCYQVSVSRSRNGPYYIAGSPFGDSPLAHRFPVLFERTLYVALHVSVTSFGRVPTNSFLDTTGWNSQNRFYRVRAFLGDHWTAWSQPESVVPQRGMESQTEVVVDAGARASSLTHKWDTIGAEHLGYMLTDDAIPPSHGGATLLTSLREARQRLGFTYVIAHGVFMSDLGIVKSTPKRDASYEWTNLDSVYDKIVASGLRPIVQLSFMPPELASDPKAGTIWSYHANSSPPRSIPEWSGLVYALAKHLESRYGVEQVRQWPFDVWNEPDLCVPGIVCYWKGSASEYYRLYDASVEALRAADPLLKVGGPVSVYPSFVDGFLKHVTTHHYTFEGSRSPLDFLDVRVYDAPVDNWRPLLNRYGLDKTQIWFTEWGLHNLNDTHITDSAYAAPWIISNLTKSLPYVDHISFWNVSDDFIEKGQPKAIFHGGFGVLGLYGLPKPSFWAFYLLNELDPTILLTKVQGEEGATTISAVASTNSHSSTKVLIANVTNDQWLSDGAQALDRTVRVEVRGLAKDATYSLTSQIVDHTHSSVYDTWKSLGSPPWPNVSQLARLRDGSELTHFNLPAVTTDCNGTAILTIVARMPSLTLVSLDRNVVGGGE